MSAGSEAPKLAVQRHHEPRAFLERGGEWLLRREAENNLILGIAGALERDDPHAFEPPFYLSTIEEGGGSVIGCALRTPPFKLLLTRLPETALGALVDDVADFYGDLDSVLGPEPTVYHFGTAWTAARGGSTITGMRQGIYELREPVAPERAPAGILRRATADDLALLGDWGEAFIAETGIGNPDPRRLVRDLISEGALWVWEDRHVVAMAAATGPTPNGIRVSYVYTPPDERGRGYASVLVAELSQRLLDGGRCACFLYTDLANRTSNALYERLGYQRICSVADVELRP